jgi:radical SAM superfamily enzyme YgiQ (UPF0313 family)
VAKYGADHVVLDDDLFAARRQRLEELLVILESRRLAGRVALLCSLRSNLVDAELCRLLKRIGVHSVNLGFESGCDRVLRYLKGSGITVQTHKRALLLCREHGFEVSGNFIVGSPTETIDEMEETVQLMEFAIRNGCFKVGLFVMTPLPATKMWDVAREQGVVHDEMNWDALSFYDAEHAMLLNPDVDRKSFVALFNRARSMAYHAWLRKRGPGMLLWDSRRVCRKLLENPRRAATMAKSVLMRHA